MEENWQDNPKLAGMDHTKLDMLQQLASQVDSIDKEALAEQVRELSGRILEEL